jgi:hypothetical protein
MASTPSPASRTFMASAGSTPVARPSERSTATTTSPGATDVTRIRRSSADENT